MGPRNRPASLVLFAITCGRNTWLVVMSILWGLGLLSLKTPSHYTVTGSVLWAMHQGLVLTRAWHECESEGQWRTSYLFVPIRSFSNRETFLSDVWRDTLNLDEIHFTSDSLSHVQWFNPRKCEETWRLLPEFTHWTMSIRAVALLLLAHARIANLWA